MPGRSHDQRQLKLANRNLAYFHLIVNHTSQRQSSFHVQIARDTGLIAGIVRALFRESGAM